MGRVFPTQDEPALLLKYQTELSIDDSSALQAEIDEIWPVFIHDVEKANLTRAIISANEPAESGIFSVNRSVNFVFRKADDGSWEQVR